MADEQKVYEDEDELPREGTTAYDNRRVSKEEAYPARDLTDGAAPEAVAELPPELDEDLPERLADE